MSTDDYLDAIAEYNERCTELDGLQKFVEDAASALKFKREKIVFSQSDERLGYGAGITRNMVGAPFLIEPAKWPTSEQLMDAVQRWDAARKKAQRAWSNLAPHRQQALPRPPK